MPRRTELQWLLRHPAPSALMIDQNPAYAGLRGDPRFEALIKDPANMAPMF